MCTLQHLRDFRAQPEAQTGVIKVVFEDCANTARDIREELLRVLFPDAPVGGLGSGVGESGLTNEGYQVPNRTNISGCGWQMDYSR